MDSGVETGNESNDSLVVVHSQLMSEAPKESVVSQPQPKLELYFNNVVPNSIDTITDNRIKSNLALGCPHADQHEKRHFSLVKWSNNKEVLPLLGDTSNFPFILSQSLSQQMKDLFATVKYQRMTIDVWKQSDHCSKMKSKLSLMNRQRKVPPKTELLFTAVTTNNTELLERIVNQGKVWVNQSDALGRTPLHAASIRGYTEVVKFLLAHGADPNLKDKIGNTPLHLAAMTSRTEIVDLLLKAGTHVTSIDRYGNNPLDIAKTKLCLLQRCNSANIGHIKEEIEKVISILKFYLQKSNAATEQVETLSEICSRLTLSNSTGQIQDEVKNLLNNLESLSLS